ncbi:MAG: hypothetical protein WBL63_04565 [Candidatus Acidiferrum sp.]
MARCKSLLLVATVSACLTLLAQPGRCAKEPRLTVGILPTFNGGTATFGETFDQHLALKLFEQLRGTAAQPILLNPGRRYDPTDNDWLVEYGQQSGVDLLLITILLKTETPEKGDLTITVQSEILDLKSGSRSAPWKNVATINKRDAKLDRPTLQASLFGAYIAPSRVFEKQPLGKAMSEIAGQICAQTLQRMEGAPATHTAQRADTGQGSCDVHVKILYASKSAASKSYGIFADGRDESLNVKDGELLLHGRSGTLLLQWAMNDAPYKLPTQEFYQASTEVDCSKPQLSINIGAAGEALLVWRNR